VNKRILKFISSSWDQFKSLGIMAWHRRSVTDESRLSDSRYCKQDASHNTLHAGKHKSSDKCIQT